MPSKGPPPILAHGPLPHGAASAKRATLVVPTPAASAAKKPLPEMSRVRSVRRATNVPGAVISLSYPSVAGANSSLQAIETPTANLSALTDSRSNYQSVVRSCLQLNQFAGADMTVTHDSSYARTMNTLVSALTQCLQSHQDRRCRILASKTLAIVARSAYGRIRHSPLLFATRESTLNRLEDEVGTDIPVTLANVALEESDDGVSATAIEALAILTLSSSAVEVGTLMVEDELLRDIEAIAHVRPAPHAPSLANLSDEDPSIPQMELQTRIFENSLRPKIWRLVRRVLQYTSASHRFKALPFVTTCLIYLIRMNPSVTHAMNQAVYAKRWIEVDIPGLVYDVVMGILLPSMREGILSATTCAFNTSKCNLSYTAALCALRLVHVCPQASWAMDIANWASVVLTQLIQIPENMTNSPSQPTANARGIGSSSKSPSLPPTPSIPPPPILLEHTMGILSTLLIALRGIPVQDRLQAMQVIIYQIQHLPSTTMVPKTVTSSGFPIGNFYHRPARMGYLAEVALSFLVDGPDLRGCKNSSSSSSNLTSSLSKRDGSGDAASSSSSTMSSPRVEALKTFFASSQVHSLLSSRSSFSAPATPQHSQNARKPQHLGNQWHSSNSLSSNKDDINRISHPHHQQHHSRMALNERFSGSHVAEEFVMAFCQVASAIGEQVILPQSSSSLPTNAAAADVTRHEVVRDWLQCSIAILTTCSVCVNWKARTTLDDDSQFYSVEDQQDHDPDTLFTMLTACQTGFIRLLMECLYATGLLSPSSSISLHLLPSSTPPRILLLEDLAQSITWLARYKPIRGAEILLPDINKLVDQLVEYKLRLPIPSRHMRLCLVCALTDYWVQTTLASDDWNNHSNHSNHSNHHKKNSKTRSSQEFNMKDVVAKELLAMISEEICLLTREILQQDEIDEDEEDDYIGDDAALMMQEINLRYMQICVAAVENIALMACDLIHRPGNNNSNNEEVSYIISAAMSVLEGENLKNATAENSSLAPSSDGYDTMTASTSAASHKNHGFGNSTFNNDGASHSTSHYPMQQQHVPSLTTTLPMCAEAMQRIESMSVGLGNYHQHNHSSAHGNGDNGRIPSYPGQAMLHSLLVKAAAHDFQMRVANLQPGEECPFSPIQRSPLFDDQVEVPLVLEDGHVHAYFVHYCQQVIGSRIDMALLSSSSSLSSFVFSLQQQQQQLQRGGRRPTKPAASSNDLLDSSGNADLLPAEDSEPHCLCNVRTQNFLRLTPPPLPPNRMPLLGTPAALRSRVSWAGSVTALSGGSDPVSFVMAYSMRRCPRYDCEPEFKLMVSLRVHNLTSVHIVKGLRMDLRVTQQRSAFETEERQEVVVLKCLTTSTYKQQQEIRAGDQVTWEVAVDHWPMKGYIELHPSLTFREMEGDQIPPKIMLKENNNNNENDDASSTSRDRKSLGSKSKSTLNTDDDDDDEDDSTEADHSLEEERTIGEEEDEALDIVLSAEPVQLSPMLGMQPCPLVFFRDGRGDVSTFRFLWYQMPHRMPEMILFPNQLPGKLIGSSTDDFGSAIANLATIPIEEYMDGIGTVSLGWAFTTLMGGDRMMCIMIESVEVDNETGLESLSATLHFRSDNEALLYSIMGSDSTRNIVVTSLTGDQWTCDDQVNGLFGL